MIKTSVYILLVFMLVISSCSLYMPSPVTGLYHDVTPRVLSKGRHNLQMATGVARRVRAETVTAGLIYSYGLKNNAQLSLIGDGTEINISAHDTFPEIIAEGYYLGTVYKSRLFDSLQSQHFSAAWYAGIGFGEKGDLLGYLDTHAGISAGWNNAYFCPYIGITAGYSHPYKRRYFQTADPDYMSMFVAQAPADYSAAVNFRFVKALWLSNEYGVELPFGNRTAGLRAFMAYSLSLFVKLEKDHSFAEYKDTTAVFSNGFEGLFKMGVSYTF